MFMPYKEIPISVYELFRCRLVVDLSCRLENGKVHVVRPIWNRMFEHLKKAGLAPEVRDCRIYIRLPKRSKRS